MVYCLNPNCPKPENPDGHPVCQSCGQVLTCFLRNRYKIIRLLGRGGFGKTYLAEDRDRQNARCVIKQLAPSPKISQNLEIFNKAVTLFNQEAEQLIKLEDYPQIPTLFAYFEEHQYLYLVQQWIEGETLLDEFNQQGIFNENKIRELLQDILPTLQYIHEHHIIHRDIKPQNIIRRRKDQKLVLIDFGVSKQISTTFLTGQGTIIGTLGYAPMEQLRGRVYPASDLYSLAVTCIRLMTGCFLRQNGSDPLYDSLEGDWLWRENLPQNAFFTAELGEILDKLLSKSVKKRYQSAKQVLEALTSLQEIFVEKQIVFSPDAQANTEHFVTTLISAPSSGSENILNSLNVFSFATIMMNTKGEIIHQQTQQQARYFSEDLGHGITLDMVYIPGGTVMMGSPKTEVKRNSDGREEPYHQVTIQPFFMSKYPITQAQWAAIVEEPQQQRYLSTNPSRFLGENRPVERVNWYDAMEWCARLSAKTKKGYRLPSEAEWEYGCRGGTTTPFSFGETLTTNLANYDGNDTYAQEPTGKESQETTEVGCFSPNTFGLYDMHGNVLEWCADPWHPNYEGAPSNGEIWDEENDQNYYHELTNHHNLVQILADTRHRILRGGSWCYHPKHCRSASRSFDFPDARTLLYDGLGFRVVSVLGDSLPGLSSVSQSQIKTSGVENSLPPQPIPEKESTLFSPDQSVLGKTGKSLKTFEFQTITVNRQGNIIKAETKQAQYFLENLGNGVTLDMVYIPGGTFMMGSPEAEASDGEKPQHRVTLPPYFMSKYPITQVQWAIIAQEPKRHKELNANPAWFKGENQPVEQVSWYDAIEWCARLSTKTGKAYRLPSEAEWEYGCRAGTTTPFSFGETLTTDLVNYDSNYTYAAEPKGKRRVETTEVGSFPPNAFGLYDMHGNVWEWCADPWHPNYKGAPSDGEIWDEDKNRDYYQMLTNNDYLVKILGNKRHRILRGGSWFYVPGDCRSACRNNASPSLRRDINHCGFRVVFRALAWT